MVYFRLCSDGGCFIRFSVEWPHHLMKANLVSSKLFPTVPLSLRLAITNFSCYFQVSRCSQSTALKRGVNSGEFSYSETSALFASRHGLRATRQSHRYPSLPNTRLEIRPRWFHIDSRHLLGKLMIQFKPEPIHGRQLSAQPEPDMRRYPAK